MIIVLTKNASPRGDRFKIIGPFSKQFSLITLSYEPTQQERRSGWTENLKDLPIIIKAFSKASIPTSSHVYGLLSFPTAVEYEEVRDELSKENLPMISQQASHSRLRGLRSFLAGRKSFHLRVANLSAERVSRLYENYDDWRMIPHVFLISSRTLDNWATVLDALTQPVIVDERFLETNGNILTNRFEHEVQLLGLDLRTQDIVQAAIEVAKQLEIPLEVIE